MLLPSLLAAGLGLAGTALAQSRPNIVVIMTDDQDKLLGSLDYQSAVQREMIGKGTEFVNHYTNTALCCPSRSSFLRGQTVHNTNMTNVVVPGGSYNKWIASHQDENYLPHWLKKAGYRNEYVGKLMNGYGISNYDTKPKGWDWSDVLVEPYIDDFNAPVFSKNGETPVYYKGFHQTDVTRIKALDRLDALTADGQDQPFSLIISPFAPHVAFQSQKPAHRPIPLARHNHLFEDVKAPRTPNFNPDDEYQSTKGGWLGGLQRLNESAISWADYAHRSRLQALQGVDEIVEDVIAKLEDKGIIDNTYIIYTSDNGYHLGQHRVAAGKSLYFAEDTNLPFIVRGPGVPQNKKSTIPGLHLDLAPTFLDIAGVAEADWPELFDGRSLLPQWHDPTTGGEDGAGKGNGKESINVEYWGSAGIEAPSGGQRQANTYKTVRTLGSDGQKWLYTKWCSGEAELYNTSEDQYELTNLVPGGEHSRVVDRLNALLMVTKSCEQGACRDPWSLLKPGGETNLTTLAQALEPEHDDFFADFPKVSFQKCIQIQDTENEGPYFPELEGGASSGLGRAWREPTSGVQQPGGAMAIKVGDALYGDEDQRHSTAADIEAASRPLTDEEIAAR